MKLKFFDLAKKLSTRSDHRHKLGAVIVRKNRIISFGWNETKTHSKSNHPWKALHAETSAIIYANPKELIGSEIYIYRELKDGTPADSRPCEFCMKLIRQVGIETIYFSKDGNYWEKEL